MLTLTDLKTTSNEIFTFGRKLQAVQVKMSIASSVSTTNTTNIYYYYIPIVNVCGALFLQCLEYQKIGVLGCLSYYVCFKAWTLSDMINLIFQAGLTH